MATFPSGATPGVRAPSGRRGRAPEPGRAAARPAPLDPRAPAHDGIGMASPDRWLGKYRGTVVNDADPLQRGRLLVLAPAVSDQPLGWALPCVPYAPGGLAAVPIPPVGASVWVEFEAGDFDRPVWSGVFWGRGQ